MWIKWIPDKWCGEPDPESKDDNCSLWESRTHLSPRAQMWDKCGHGN